MAAIIDSPWNGSAFAPATPLDIATIEASILRQLRSQVTAIEIAHYPDRPETYRLTHRIGAALVRYDGAWYGPLLDTSAAVQQRRMRFAIRLVMRDLGWGFGGDADGPSPGAYAMIEAVRAALAGFEIAGCSKMRPVRERFIERDKQGGVWVYEIVFALTTMAVEAASADTFPLFTMGVARETGGITTVSAGEISYTFNSGDQIRLPAGNITSLSISNPATGISYAAGIDYYADYILGVITRAPTGAIMAGTTVSIMYSSAEAVTAVASGGSSPIAPSN